MRYDKMPTCTWIKGRLFILRTLFLGACFGFFPVVSYFLLPFLLLVTAEYILHLSATSSSCSVEMWDAEKRESRRLIDGAVLYL